MIDDPILAADIGARWVAVRRRIEAAATAAGRDPSAVRVVAVTKGFGPEVVRAATTAGLNRFGENRVQEGESKIPEAPDAEWHLIGHLQGNKARRAVTAFPWIHGVDSLELLGRLQAVAAELDQRPRVLLQVNVAEAATQHGFAAAALTDPGAREALVAALRDASAVDVTGVMAIGPMTDDHAISRSAFATVRQLRDALEEASGHPLPELSMGMSADLEAAVEEGATLVRVGGALFGERPASL
jgi:PLP dependent protein